MATLPFSVSCELPGTWGFLFFLDQLATSSMISQPHPLPQETYQQTNLSTRLTAENQYIVLAKHVSDRCNFSLEQCPTLLEAAVTWHTMYTSCCTESCASFRTESEPGMDENQFAHGDIQDYRCCAGVKAHNWGILVGVSVEVTQQ